MSCPGAKGVCAHLLWGSIARMLLCGHLACAAVEVSNGRKTLFTCAMIDHQGQEEATKAESKQ